MSTYLIVQANIKNREQYNQIIDEAIPIFTARNARILAASNDTKTLELEGSESFERTLVIEFGSETDLNNWYETIRKTGFLKRWLAAAGTHIVSYINGVERV